MNPNLYGLNEDDDLDELFNENSPIVPSEFVYRSNRNINDQSKSALITNDGGRGQHGGDTDLQFNNLLQESLKENLMNCNSNDGESQSCTKSTTSQSIETFSGLSFHSLLRRNLIEQAPTPMVEQNEDVRILPTQDNPLFSPLFGGTQSSFHLASIHEDRQYYHDSQTNVVEPTGNGIDHWSQDSNNPNFLLTPKQPSQTSSNLDVHSFLRRNLIDEPLSPIVQQNNDGRISSTRDSPLFSQLFERSQSSFHSTRFNEDRQYYPNNQTNVTEPISSRFDLRSQDSNNLNSCTPKPPSQFHLGPQRLSNLPQNYSSLNIFGSHQPPEHIAANMSSIPNSILNLYKQIKESDLSDWAFVHALSAQTCQEFTPMDSYIMLKTSLLLSIASINAVSDRTPIPIIAIGTDCTSADSIMKHIGNFAQRFLAPTDQMFNVSMNSDKFVEVGPVFLAKNGVCYLGNWSGLTKSVLDEIKIIIGSGRFCLDNSLNFKLGSAIWTHCSSTGNFRKDRQNVTLFLKYFGIPIVMDTDRSDTMIEFILEEAMNGQVEIPEDGLHICYEDMKTYLNIIRKIEVKTSKSARILLKTYCDAIRLDREDALSPRGLEIIEQMTESYAKMCLRDTVLDCDVIAVIAIFEKTLRGMIGVIGVSPAPMLYNVRRIDEVDDYMIKFEKWIYDYLRIFKQSQT